MPAAAVASSSPPTALAAARKMLATSARADGVWGSSGGSGRGSVAPCGSGTCSAPGGGGVVASPALVGRAPLKLRSLWPAACSAARSSSAKAACATSGSLASVPGTYTACSGHT